MLDCEAPTVSTVATAANPAGSFDVGAGYGRRQASSGFLGHWTAHGNFVYEKSTGIDRLLSNRAVGGAAGLALGVLIARLLTLVFPALPVSTPWWFALLAEGMAVSVGLVAGVFPARQAARMEPVEALRAE